MGRQKGTVELALEQGQVDQVCTQMKEIMPEKVSGALEAAPEKIFNEYACKSAQPQIGHVSCCFLFAQDFEPQCLLLQDFELQCCYPKILNRNACYSKILNPRQEPRNRMPQ